MTDMTLRQRRFAEEYAACGNATESAKKAGYSNKTAYAQGSRLLKKVEVAARITELQAEATKRAAIEADDVIDMLLESYKDAKRANQHGPAIRAVELLGKHLALFKDRTILTEEAGVSDDFLIKAVSQGDPEMEAMARKMLGAPDTFDA